MLEPFEIDESYRNDTIDDIDSLRKKIFNLNEKIIGLMEERRFILDGIEDKIIDISSAEYMFGIGIGELEREWDDKKFNSEVVKRAVMTVRKTFFDDSDEAFRSYNCSCIGFEYSSHCYSSGVMYVNFNFTNTKNMFSVCIPMVSRRDYRGWNPRDREEPFAENKWLGSIFLTMRIGDCLTDSFSHSPRFDVIRKALVNLVHDFDKVKADRLEENRQMYLSYDPNNQFKQYDQRFVNEIRPRDDSLGEMMKYYGFIE